MVSEERKIEEAESLKFEELLERFKAKMDSIPVEYHPAMGWLYVYRQIQDQRKRLVNRSNQMSEGKQVFWGSVLTPEASLPMREVFEAAAEGIAKNEATAERNLAKTFKHTSWFQEVAVEAAEGSGISPNGGFISAAKLMWAYGSASKFESFGKIVRYSRLAPENGKAPRRAAGKRISYNPQAWQALFDLSETWLRMKDSPWRIKWDFWKVYYAEQHPDYPKGRVHNMARRKVIREFLRNLWEYWRAWEEREVEEAA